MTNGDDLRKTAEQQGIPLRTLDQVRAGLEHTKTFEAEVAMAKLMLRYGRMTDEAVLYIGDTYPDVWE